MISFLSGTLIAEDPWCTFTLKQDIKNYLWQSTKTLSICFRWNTAHTDLRMCYCIWLEQLNVCAKYENLSDKSVCFTG